MRSGCGLRIRVRGGGRASRCRSSGRWRGSIGTCRSVLRCGRDGDCAVEGVGEGGVVGAEGHFADDVGEVERWEELASQLQGVDFLVLVVRGWEKWMDLL